MCTCVHNPITDEPESGVLYSQFGVPCPHRAAGWACERGHNHACPASRCMHGTRDARSRTPMLPTLSTRLSTLDFQLLKMGFVQNDTNWSDKTQVRNSPAMGEIDRKIRAFCKFDARQNSGFCPLQSCWLFLGQNGQNPDAKTSQFFTTSTSWHVRCG